MLLAKLDYIPVADSAFGFLLHGDDGLPIWPLSSVEDRIALELTAALFGASLKAQATVCARDGSDLLVPDRNVMALGPQASEAARLYCHLTSRSLVEIDVGANLAAFDPPDVLVTLWDNLTVELLDWLYSRDGSAPGIIAAPDVSDLRRQALIRSAALRLRHSEVPRACNLLPLRNDRLSVVDAGTTIGGAAERDIRRSALMQGADIMSVMSHSDGVDAFLGSDLTLCARRGERAAPIAGPSPLCQITGHCHRHNRPVSDIVESEDVLAPEEVAARILLFDTCFGVMPRGSLVDPRYGLGTRFASSPLIGAFVTPWQLVLTNSDDTLRLQNDMLSGATVGEAVARFNAHPDSRARHGRMCLFGDPEMRISSPISELSSIPTVNDQASAAAPDASVCAASEQSSHHIRENVALLHQSMNIAQQMASGARFTDAARHAASATAVMMSMLSAQTPACRDMHAAMDNMRRAVLDYALLRGKLVECWMPSVTSYEPGASIPCVACDRPAQMITANLRSGRGGQRRLTLCPICGVTEDAPPDAHLHMSLDKETVRLIGALPAANFCAGLALSASDPALSIPLYWPTDSDGKLSSELVLPPKVPNGPLRISIFLLWDASFVVMSRLARGASGHIEMTW